MDRHIGQHVEQVLDVEADIDRRVVVADFDFFLRLFLLGVVADDLEQSLGENQPYATES